MDIHKPKPVHSWREFVSEIGIVVLGIVIALTGEQAIEALHWHHQTSVAREGIRRDYAQDAAVFEERIALQKCAVIKLEGLSLILNNARRSGSLPDIEEIGRTPVRPLSRSAWTAAVAGNIVDRMGDEERRKLSEVDAEFATYDADSKLESTLWAILSTLRHSPGPVSDSLLTENLITLAKLRGLNGYNNAVAEYGLTRLRKMDVAPDYTSVVEDADEARASRAFMLTNVNTNPLCKPIR